MTAHFPNLEDQVNKLRILTGVRDVYSTGILPNQTFISAANKSVNETSEPATAPEKEELLGLVQQQDTILTQLCAELDTCKTDVAQLRQKSLNAFDSNEKIFAKLKDLLESKELLMFHEPSKSNDGKFTDGRCANCVEQRRKTQQMQTQIEKLTTELEMNQETSKQVTRSELETIEKMSEALQLAQQLEDRKTEVDTRLAHALDTITQLRHQIAQHEQTLTSQVQERVDEAVGDTNNQLQQLTTKNTDLESRCTQLSTDLEQITIERDRLQIEYRKIEESRRKEKTNYDQEACSLRSQLTALEQSEQKALAETKRCQNALRDAQQAQQQSKATDQAIIDKLNDQLVNAQRSLDDQARLLTAECDEKRLIRTELSTCHASQSRLEQDLQESLMFQQSKLRQALSDMQRQHDANTLDLEQLVETQRRLIRELREQCQTLTDTLEHTNKRNRKELKQLRRQHQDMVNQLEAHVTH